MNAPTYTAPRRDYRFMTPYERAHEAAIENAMAAMTDANSDELQAACVAAIDDLHDFIQIAAEWFKSKDATHVGTLLGGLLDKHAASVCNDEAERQTETVPRTGYEVD